MRPLRIGSQRHPACSAAATGLVRLSISDGLLPGHREAQATLSVVSAGSLAVNGEAEVASEELAR